MKNSLTMSVRNRARDRSHHLHTFARILAKGRSRGTKAPTSRIFHAKIWETFFALADLVNRKNVGMIEARDRFGFAPKAHQRLMRVHLMSEDALYRNDPAGMLLARTINQSPNPTADLFQSFVIPV